MATAEQVREALKVVSDPEIGINIVDLGLVYDVTVSEEGAAEVTYTLTTMGCPVGPLFQQEITDAVASLEGITSVEAKMTLQPPWGPEKMSEFAKSALGFF
ncbi:MAG TPA: metal-sulfur cluster assembly factor [Actinomycetota bacterium]|nr:metal-sulfur cluster assembly factor [Actinomycetota bacterium]